MCPVSEELLRLEKLGDEIAVLSAHIEAATYRLLVLIGEFDQKLGWNDGTCRSCAHWLNWRCGIDLGAARERVRVARALENLPLISEALRTARISYSKARALTRVATPENEEDLLNIALYGTASHVEKVVRAWRRFEETAEANRQYEGRYVRTYFDEDGSLVLKARLTPEVGALLRRALEAATEALYSPDQEVDVEQRRADALGLIAETALSGGLDKGSRGDRYQVVVHVDAPVLADPGRDGQSLLEEGVRVSAETSRRIACDASQVVMTHGPDGQVLDVGRKTRTVPAAIRRALESRDARCRFPGCGLDFCDAHHIEHWANGGETKLDNLMLLCRRHHRAVHEGGFRAELLPNGETQFYRPDGRVITEAPPPPDIGPHPVAALRLGNLEDGLRIGPRTVCPDWDGKPMDLDWVMNVLLEKHIPYAEHRHGP